MNRNMQQLLKNFPSYEDYKNRSRKTLYYGKLPSTDRPSLPMTGLLVEKFNDLCEKGRLDNLDLYSASSICYESCVTPCSVIISLLYLERLKRNNPDYLETTPPSHVFIVAMMIASKYLYDDGEEDEVYNGEWAASAAMHTADLNQVEREFLSAINWDLYVDMKAFMTALLYIEVEVAKDESLFRGFYTYSDLSSLSYVLPSIWTTLINPISSALAVCILGYASSIFGATLCSHLMLSNQSYDNKTELHSISDEPHERIDTIPDVINASDHDMDVLQSTEDLTWHLEIVEEKIPRSNRNTITSSVQPFSALSTLTAALLLASSTSGHYSSLNPFHREKCIISRKSFHSLSSFSASSISPMSCHCDSSKELMNSYSKIDNSVEHCCKFHKMESVSFDLWKPLLNSSKNLIDSSANVTEIVFRPEYDAFTTGKYWLPSYTAQKNYFKGNETESLEFYVEFKIEKFFHKLILFFYKFLGFSSKNFSYEWMEDIFNYFHWKSPPKIHGEYNLNQLKYSVPFFVK